MAAALREPADVLASAEGKIASFSLVEINSDVKDEKVGDL